MEGWDGTRDGEPSDLTRRRWRNFGISGAKLIWGGEAVAVRHDGRANPNQLLMTPATQPAIAALRERADRRAPRALRRERRRRSLRRPSAHALGPLRAADRLRSAGAARRRVRHPVLDRRFPNGVRVLTDDELDAAGGRFRRRGAPRARRRVPRSSTSRRATAISVTSCSAPATRSGRYGGPLENRTRFMRRVIEAHPRGACPGCRHRRPPLGVRHGAVSQAARTAIGEPEPVRLSNAQRSALNASPGFGVVASDEQLDAALDESRARCCGCSSASASAGSA